MKPFWKRRHKIAPPPKIIGQPILPVIRAGVVEPLYARASEAVPGPFYVQSDQCIICALPPETAPGNIQFLPNAADERCPHYCYVHKQPETVEELERTLEALCFSCVAAIRYCGTDPSILQTLEAAGARDQCDALATRNA